MLIRTQVKYDGWHAKSKYPNTLMKGCTLECTHLKNKKNRILANDMQQDITPFIQCEVRQRRRGEYIKYLTSVW